MCTAEWVNVSFPKGFITETSKTVLRTDPNGAALEKIEHIIPF